MRYSILITAVTLTTLGVSYTALAADDCEVPMADWQPRTAVEQLAQSKGWAVRRIKIDDGCYEIKGRNATGEKIEVKIHPATLAIVEMEIEGEDDEDEGKNRGTRGSSITSPESGAAATSPAPKNPLINGKAPPSVVVE